MNNQIQALAILPKLSEQQLVQALQANDGTLPAYAVMAELQARKKRAAGFTSPQMPKTSVKQDMLAQAGGLPSVATQPPPQMPMQAPNAALPSTPLPGMARGGKIGYADGGATGSWDDTEVDPDTGMPYTESIKRAFGALVGLPGKALNWMVSAPGSGGPFASSSRAQTAPSYGPAGSASNYPQAAPPAMPAQQPPMPQPTPDQSSGLNAISATVKMPGGGVNMPAAAAYVPKEITPRSMEDILKEMPKDTSVGDAIKQLKAGDTSAKDLQDAKWEALMRTGLTMASTPGNFGYALGKGGEQGLNSLMANRKMIQQDQIARDREMRNLAIAQGRQQIQDYGVARGIRSQDIQEQQSEETARYRAAQLAEQQAEHRATLANALQVAGIHANAAKASQDELNRMKLVESAVSDVEREFQLEVAKNPMQYMNKDPNELRAMKDQRVYQRLQMFGMKLSPYYQMQQPQGTGILQNLPNDANVRAP